MLKECAWHAESVGHTLDECTNAEDKEKIANAFEVILSKMKKEPAPKAKKAQSKQRTKNRGESREEIPETVITRYPEEIPVFDRCAEIQGRSLDHLGELRPKPLVQTATIQSSMKSCRNWMTSNPGFFQCESDFISDASKEFLFRSNPGLSFWKFCALLIEMA